MKKHSKTIVSGTAFLFIGNLVRIVFTFIINIFIGQFLGAARLGAYAIANTIFLILSTLSIFGFYHTISRFIPEYKIRKDKEKMRRIILTFLKFSILSSIIYAVVTVLSTSTDILVLTSEDSQVALKYLIISLPFYVIIRITGTIYITIVSTKLLALVENIIVPILTAIFLGVLILIDVNQDIIVSLSFALSYFISAVISTSIFLRNKKIRDLRILTSLGIFEKRYVLYSLPMVVNLISVLLLNRYNYFTIGNYVGNEQAGIFSLALTLLSIPTMLKVSINMIFQPTVSGLNSLKKAKSIKTASTDIVRLSLLISLPIFTVITVFSDNILFFFGKDFVMSKIFLLILSLGLFSDVITGPVDPILNALDKQKLTLMNTIIAAVINIVLGFILIPSHNIMGAAIALSISLITKNTIGYIQLNQMKSVNFITKRTLKIILVSILASVLSYMINCSILDINIDNILLLGLQACIFLLIQLAFLVIFKTYHSKDKKLLVLIINKLKIKP